MQSIKLNQVAQLHDFKENIEKYIAELKKGKQPLILMENGANAAVLLDHELFQRMVEQIEFLKKVAKGMEDMEAGRVMDFEKTFEEIDQLLNDTGDR